MGAKWSKFAGRPTGRDLRHWQVATLEAARKLEAAGEPITYASVAATAGCSKAAARDRIAALTRDGRWRWTVVKFAGPAGKVLEGDPKAVAERACPATMSAVRAEAYAGMGDGRSQVDDPREHGACCVPRSGIDHKPPAKSAAEECRDMLRQYRRIRRGVPPAKAEEVGVAHNVKSPASPREARVYRLAPMQYTRAMREA